MIRPNVIDEFRAGIERKDEGSGADESTPVPTVFADQFKGNGVEFMKATGLAWIPGLDPMTSSSLPLINIGNGSREKLPNRLAGALPEAHDIGLQPGWTRFRPVTPQDVA